jgi:hypothetical protein
MQGDMLLEGVICQVSNLIWQSGRLGTCRSFHRVFHCANNLLVRSSEPGLVLQPADERSEKEFQDGLGHTPKKDALNNFHVASPVI